MKDNNEENMHADIKKYRINIEYSHDKEKRKLSQLILLFSEWDLRLFFYNKSM